MKDIKDYRGNELKYFVIANISALLYFRESYQFAAGNL